MTDRANTTKYDLTLGLPVLDKPTVKKIISEHYSKIGKKGGKKTALRGAEHYRAMQRKGIETKLYKKMMRESEL